MGSAEWPTLICPWKPSRDPFREGIAMHPMKEFDPTKPAMVHDRLNDRTFEWKPATMQANYEKYVRTGCHRMGRPVARWLAAAWRSALVSAVDQADAVFRHVRSGSNSPFWLSDHHFRCIPNIRHSRPRPALRKSARTGNSAQAASICGLVFLRTALLLSDSRRNSPMPITSAIFTARRD
jgi:hypothetical protein